MFNLVRLNDKVEEVKLLMNREMKNYCQEGRVQEIGRETEALIADLISLLEGASVTSSKSGSVADVVLKIDLLVKFEDDDFTDYYALQVKSSEAGCNSYKEQYGEEIEWEGKIFPRPDCLYKGTKTPLELLDELCDIFCCNISIDLEYLEEVYNTVNKSNGKRQRKDVFRKLSRKELRALKVLYKVRTHSKTLFI